MKDPKDLTVEDFLAPWHYRDLHKDDYYTEDVTKGVIDFAKYHVRQALRKVAELQNLKQVHNYPVELTEEELDNIYLLENIK